MIKGVHTLFYTSQPEELRAFLRDKLEFPSYDVGGGWLMFDLPSADMACHPVDNPENSGKHDISFYCEDLEGTIKELEAKGVEFVGGIHEETWGRMTHFKVPGDFQLMLFEPKY